MPVNCEPWSEWIRTRFFGLRRQTATGRAARLAHPNGKTAGDSIPVPGLIKQLLKAREWWSHIAMGEIDISTPFSKEPSR
jgi:hypothetical protein